MKEYFELYKTSPINKEYSLEKRNDKYVKEKTAIKYIKDKYNLNLLECVKKIEETNPYENGYTLRDDYNYLINKRKKLKDEEVVKNNFGALKEDKTKLNDAEQMIQRHIMLSDKYENILGKSIFNEFVPNMEEDRNKKSIDLITYRKKDNTINLIELKKCSYIMNKNDGDSSDTTENFVKVALQVSTYYSFFIHALKNNEIKLEIKRALDEVGNVNIDIDNVNVRGCILAPAKLFVTDLDDDELTEFKEHYDLYTIKLSDEYDDLRKYPVNSNEKLFEIDRF